MTPHEYDDFPIGDAAQLLTDRWRTLSATTRNRLQHHHDRWLAGDIDDAEFELALQLEYRRRTNERLKFHDKSALLAEMGTGARWRHRHRSHRSGS